MRHLQKQREKNTMIGLLKSKWKNASVSFRSIAIALSTILLLSTFGALLFITMQNPQTDYLQTNNGRTLQADSSQPDAIIDDGKDMQLFKSLSAVLQYESKYPGKTMANEQKLNEDMVLLAMCYYTHNILLQKFHNQLQSYLALKEDPIDPVWRDTKEYLYNYSENVNINIRHEELEHGILVELRAKFDINEQKFEVAANKNWRFSPVAEEIIQINFKEYYTSRGGKEAIKRAVQRRWKNYEDASVKERWMLLRTWHNSGIEPFNNVDDKWNPQEAHEEQDPMDFYTKAAPTRTNLEKLLPMYGTNAWLAYWKKLDDKIQAQEPTKEKKHELDVDIELHAQWRKEDKDLEKLYENAMKLGELQSRSALSTTEKVGLTFFAVSACYCPYILIPPGLLLMRIVYKMLWVERM